MQFGKLGKIGVGWTILVIIGISSFALSKSSIDQKRYENMKVRERMKKSNEGKYQLPERFEGRDLDAKSHTQ
ncbi:hypothetical protein PVAND_002392 [Polypedilum vanderplanki]|uniref:Uncharacterized protein n=1 Tax=Polypedilum vanderplanki TaxID=319348 RepID=A0A9J6BR77_POLVA|nr:hypothetical protein PVAND_002392 [Polypedilum vanderplanki]